MRPNPLTDLAFLVETDRLWFTLIFWLLLLGSVAAAYTATARHTECTSQHSSSSRNARVSDRRWIAAHAKTRL
jgi:membrane protein required for beta-lactamase induction